MAGLGIALAALAAIGGAWLSRSSLHREGRPLSALPQGRNVVLVAHFENLTGEKLFDGTLDYALGRELSNSQRITVASRDRVNDALRLMRKTPDTQIDPVVAREVCLRDGGIQSLITGRVQKAGRNYLLSVELVDPRDGATLTGFSEESAGTSDSLPAIQRISDRVRASLGERPARDNREPAGLAKVTTESLKALQLYSRADALMMEDEDHQGAAEELLRQAVAEDPTFASAWIHLAFALSNQGRPLAEVQPYAAKAMRFSDTTSERERYFIRGGYYQFFGQREKAVAAYEALVDLYPDHLWAMGNLIFIYDWLHNPEELAKAVQLEARRADSRPNDFIANWGAAFDLVAFKPDQARAGAYVRRARELLTPELRERFSARADWLELLPFTESWLRGELVAAAAELDQIAAKAGSLAGYPRDCLLARVALGYLTLGRIEAAARTSFSISDPVVRNDMLAQIDFIRGDSIGLRNHLQFPGERKMFSHGSLETTYNLRLRAGILSDSESCREGSHWKGPYFVDEEAHRCRGEIALARGNRAVGIRELEEAWKLAGDRYYVPSYSLGREELAAVLAKQGDVPQAIRILERNPERFYAVISGTTGAYWLIDRWELAKLYRRVGRQQDARAVEAELSKLLALADSNHPIVRELQRLASSSPQPAG
jgi:tetratricopeptide (TPR) repeat protein